MRLWITKKTNEDTLYREILAPFYFRPRCQGANLKLDELQCLVLSLLKYNFGLIQKGAKAFVSEEELKKKNMG